MFCLPAKFDLSMARFSVTCSSSLKFPAQILQLRFLHRLLSLWASTSAEVCDVETFGGGRALGQRVRRAGWRGTESLSGPDTSCFENGQTKESNQGEGNAEESLWCSCLTEWSSCRWVLPPRCLAAWHCECKAMCKSCQCGVKLFLHLSKVWFSDVLFSC